MRRITNADIKGAIDRLNRTLNRPVDTWTRFEDGKTRANVGNFHEYSAYNMVGLHEVTNESGGVRSHGGLGTKRELYERIQAMLDGIGLVNPF